MRVGRRRATALLSAATLAATVSTRRAAAALVLALDLSASVTPGALAFQLRGHALALRDASVRAGLADAGPPIAVTVVGYAGPERLQVLVPWARMVDEADVAALAARLDALPHPRPRGNTAIGAALLRAADRFASLPGGADRCIIDLVANGFSNAGIDPATARDRLADAGITVNVLAVLDTFPWLDAYARDTVIGGPGAFAMPVAAGADVAVALRRKLQRELASPRHPAGRSRNAAVSLTASASPTRSGPMPSGNAP